MKHLAIIELISRGDRSALVSKNADEVATILAFVYMDRERRYFVATASSLEEGSPAKRNRWRQIDRSENALPDNVELTVPQPRAVQEYYGVCGKVDQHNRDRQDTLQLERKLKTHDWSQRVNMSILGIIIVDSWRMYQRMTFPPYEDYISNTEEVQKIFYSHLAAEMIDNRFDEKTRRRNNYNSFTAANFADESNGKSSDAVCYRTGAPRCGAAAHLTPTKRYRVTKDGLETKTRFQGHCRVCKTKRFINVHSVLMI